MERPAKEEMNSTLIPLHRHQDDAQCPKVLYSAEQPRLGPYIAPYGQHYAPMPVESPSSALLSQPEPEYLWYSVFTMTCCCFPLGIAAFVYSLGTRDANRIGHHELAKKNSQRARNLNHIGLALGILSLILCIVFACYYAATIKKMMGKH